MYIKLKKIPLIKIRKRKIAIAYAITSDRIFELAISLISIENYLDNVDYDIHIFTDNIKDQNLLLLKKINSFRKIFFHSFSKDDLLKIITIKEFNSIKNFISRFSIMPFAKIEAISLLEEYNELIIFDSDIILIDSLKEILNQDTYQKNLCFMPKYSGWDSEANKKNIEKYLNKYPICNYKTIQNSPFCCCANLTYIKNLSINPQLLIKHAYQYFRFILENNEDNFLEEKCFSAIFSIFCNFIPLNNVYYNCYPNTEILPETKIIHFGTNFRKPFVNPIIYFTNPYWQALNLKWKKILVTNLDNNQNLNDEKYKNVIFTHNFRNNIYPRIPKYKNNIDFMLSVRYAEAWSNIFVDINNLLLKYNYNLFKFNPLNKAITYKINNKIFDTIYVILDISLQDIKSGNIILEINSEHKDEKYIPNLESFGQLIYKKYNIKYQVSLGKSDLKIRFNIQKFIDYLSKFQNILEEYKNSNEIN